MRGEQEKEDIGRGVGCVDMMEENWNVPAIERRTRDGCGSDDDQTFVRRRISAKQESECCEYRKAGLSAKVMERSPG
jgi:hypothetical protein